MSELQRLIEQLCPDGVEYKTVQEVAEYRRGSFPQPYTNPQWYGGKNSMPFVQVADMHDDDFLLSETTKQQISEIAQPKSIYVEKGTVLVSLQGTIGRVAITQYDCYVDRTIAIFQKIKDKDLDKRFFSYVLKQKFEFEKQYARGSTLKTITKEEFSMFKIPVPPIEVQREIVRILDSFTLLTAELTAELTARKKQYEYYTRELLNFNDDIPSYQLRELIDFRNGKGHEKDIADDGKYVVVNSKFISTGGEVKKYSNKQICPLYIDDILMVMSDLPNGRALAKCFVVNENDKYTLNQRIGAFHVKDEAIIGTRFLYYVLNRNSQLLRFDNGADQTNLRKDDILNIVIPVPPIKEQERIVNILDRFDALCNDISAGLPAEIEARQKQYEYYRDKLLTFEPAQAKEII